MTRLVVLLLLLLSACYAKTVRTKTTVRTTKTAHRQASTQRMDFAAAVRGGKLEQIRAMVGRDPLHLRRLFRVGWHMGPALHLAVEHDVLPAAALLIELGADLRARDHRHSDTQWPAGNSPLHRCRSVAMTKLLIKAGASAAATNQDGEGVLYATLWVEEPVGCRMAQVMAAAGARWDIRTVLGRGSPDDVKQFLAKQPLPDWAVYLAIPRDSTEALAAVLAAKPNLEGPMRESRNFPLGLAFRDFTPLAFAVHIDNYPAAEMLLRAGASLAGQPGFRGGAHGERRFGTLLQRARTDGAKTFVRALLAAGATE